MTWLMPSTWMPRPAHVGGDHQVGLAVLEALQGRQALALRDVPGQPFAFHALAAQIAHQAVRLIAAIHEHQRVVRLVLAHELSSVARLRSRGSAQKC